ncbi:2-polyprenylphenol hydroxylase and related flavodoxin oxidoreductases / CDP-6-deoxy-delta-3,4-glucoseen reductase-like [hydrothermal vent metagenome]|uniref:2-polyprenylphenol hydroxylase and related flavodoxin oxidoreductases / CDP-6-deoxy-delta-3,4-glucoseen reductase-like n=1 Tax=hydrothermal vent metagenome TaxID=652676 RepID=A0A3B0WF56_9ZZZZ
MSFKICVPASGHEFLAEENETILAAAIRQGIGLPYGCRNGACGKCAGEVVSGKTQYDTDSLRALAKKEFDAGKTLFCQACAITDLEIKVREIVKSADIEIKTLPCRVEKMVLLTHDIMRLRLKLPETERLQFMAGQYIEIILEDGKRRAFSIANAPHDDAYIELHIRHVPDGHFGDFVFDGLKEKTLLRIEGPLGSYFLREDSSRPIIFIGGGTGFAPLKGMLEHIFHIKLNRPIHLFCGARAKRDLYMDEMVQSWLKQYKNLKYTAVLSDAPAEDNWQGETGLVHESVVKHYSDLSGHDVYLSGPPPMVKAGMDLFYEKGLPETQIYSDSFEYSDDALKAMGIQKPKMNAES